MKYVKEAGSGEYEEKKSRFIGELYPVKSEEEAQEILQQVRKKYYDARHHCFAYVLGEKGEIKKQSDDGEPSRTAGMPILDVLTGEDLRDALLVVTRYFGGTLLGTGGLVRAYTEAAKAAVAGRRLMEALDGYEAVCEAPYTLVGKLQYLARQQEVPELSIEYGAAVTFTWFLTPEKRDAFEEAVRDLSGGALTLAINKSRWYNS